MKTKVFAESKKRKDSIGKVYLKNNIELTLLGLPGILLLFVFCYIPMGGVIIAFKNYTYADGILGSKWIGFDNFKFFFTSQDAWRITRNTVGYGIVFIALGIAAGVALALILNEVSNKVSLKIYQTTMILPNFLSWVIVGYITYVFLNPTSGVLNQIVKLFGGNEIAWYSEPKYWPFILPIVQVWKSVGMGSLIYYSTLMGMDSSIFEAAEIDGAGKLQKIRYITIPSLIPIMTIMLIMNVGNVIKGDFGLFYQVTRDVGLLYPTTDIIDTYVFRALKGGSMAMSSAVGLFQSVVGFIMVIITNKIVTKIEPDNAMF